MSVTENMIVFNLKMNPVAFDLFSMLVVEMVLQLLTRFVRFRAIETWEYHTCLLSPIRANWITGLGARVDLVTIHGSLSVGHVSEVFKYVFKKNHFLS